MMKLIYILVIITMFINCNNTHKQKIKLDSNIYLDKVKNKIPQEFSIKCVNNSDKDIRLREVQVSCSCIKQIVKNNNLVHAHDSSIFHFQFIPEGIGYVEKTMNLYFDIFPEPYFIKIGAQITNN